ncbi:GTA-gp10 family protein [Haematobacter missouriensis]|uniref:Gene transfer agent family protein n=1 Tax=Haematobacter missouriensis TaxID=366616 RepID=A0A212AIY2_9RHOB|nr:GTA-gp10 family protein [Haematobacter missouriensis]OWJ81366.1 hypothetical protein CDV52_18360 [Haematobacter missouriensis]
MANSFLGEVKVVANGSTFTLRLDFNAMCAFEDASGGTSSFDLLARYEVGAIRATEMRLLIWAALQHHHPDTTHETAGDVLSADGAILRRLIAAAAPATPEDAKGRRKKQ